MMRSLLAVVESEEMQTDLMRTLGQEYDLTVCGDAREGARLLRQKPEGLILDLYLPGTTGLTFLEENGAYLPPVVLVLSGLSTAYVLQSVSRLGAGFLIRTPCTMEEIAWRLGDMFLPMEAPEEIRDHLRRLRIPAGLLGHSYLCLGVRIFAENPCQQISKELYPAIAAHFGTTGLAVEHAIRAAIHTAWSRRDPAVWDRYFLRTEKCPGNRQFIAALAEYL